MGSAARWPPPSRSLPLIVTLPGGTLGGGGVVGVSEHALAVRPATRVTAAARNTLVGYLHRGHDVHCRIWFTGRTMSRILALVVMVSAIAAPASAQLHARVL